MRTRNFYSVNASKIFACEIEESYEYDDFIIELKEELKNSINIEPDNLTNEKDILESRSYPSQVISTYSLEKKFKDFIITTYIDIVIRSGYYSGCNLDYNIRYNIVSYDILNKSDIKYELEYHFDYSEKKINMYIVFINKWINRVQTPIIKQIEDVFENMTTPLNVVGIFSDGTAVYEKN